MLCLNPTPLSVLRNRLLCLTKLFSNLMVKSANLKIFIHGISIPKVDHPHKYYKCKSWFVTFSRRNYLTNTKLSLGFKWRTFLNPYSTKVNPRAQFQLFGSILRERAITANSAWVMWKNRQGKPNADEGTRKKRTLWNTSLILAHIS